MTCQGEITAILPPRSCDNFAKPLNIMKTNFMATLLGAQIFAVNIFN